jgi:UDP-N-acetylglucosamine--N-acetylmuramyl-(pentapeptide) pyrophosphoryl-undecaprenol N-acetylglucosamine transferase
LAIKRLSQFVERVACTAEASLGYFPEGKGIVTGYPIRRELRDATKLSRPEALDHFGLTSDLSTLFVFGGSRGARSINRAIMSLLPELLNEMQIIHLSGNLDWPEVEANAQALPSELVENYRPYPYLHEKMGAAFRAANAVVARAGASMLGECPAFGLPSILIPYPYAWRYQKVNADYLVKNGAAIRLNDETLPEELLPTVMGLLKDTDRLVEMSANAKKLDKPHAEEKLANLLVSLAERAIT